MNIIFPHCRHTIVITGPHCIPVYFLPPAQTVGKNPDNSNAPTTALQLVFLHPALLYFPSSSQREAKCLSHLLSGCTTAAFSPQLHLFNMALDMSAFIADWGFTSKYSTWVGEGYAWLDFACTGFNGVYCMYATQSSSKIFLMFSTVQDANVNYIRLY